MSCSKLRYKPGDIIQARCEPFMKILHQNQSGKRCDNCFQPTASPKRCGSCHLKYYCEKSCQVTDWKFAHKVECKTEAFLQAKYPSVKFVDVNLKFQLIRLWAIIKSDPEIGNKEYKIFDGTFRTYNSLLSHWEQFKNNQVLVFECIKLAGALSKDDKKVTMESMLELYGKLVTNAFGIHDERESEEIGVGIYVQPSALNHSCKPTAFYYVKGLKLTLRAFGPVEIGQDPTISYIADHFPTTQRRKRLQTRYNFTCQCERCTKEKDGDVDFDALNVSLRKMKDLSVVAFMDWNTLYKMHQEIIETLEKIYHEYDDRITNQFTRIANYAIGYFDEKISDAQKQEILEETQRRILITYGPDHPDFKDFQCSLLLYTRKFRHF